VVVTQRAHLRTVRVARTTRKTLALHDPIAIAPWRVPEGGNGRAEDRNDRRADGRGDVAGSAVVRDQGAALREQRGEPWNRQIAGQNRGADAGELADLGTQRALGG